MSGLQGINPFQKSQGAQQAKKPEQAQGGCKGQQQPQVIVIMVPSDDKNQKGPQVVPQGGGPGQQLNAKF